MKEKEIVRAFSEITASAANFRRAFVPVMAEAQRATSAFKTSLGELQYAVSAAFAPIVSAALPALTKLTNYVASAMRTVATFVAALFGKAFAGGTQATQSMNNLGKSAGKAAGKVQKAMNLLSFDELHVMDAPSSSGGGGGGGVLGDIAGELVDITSPLKAFWDLFRQLLEPSILAWTVAWLQIKLVAAECWAQIKSAAQNLWDTALRPLATYLLTDFAPAVINAFSLAFAPIVADVISTAMIAFTHAFIALCELLASAINDVILPALELMKTIWVDAMASIQSAWETHGLPICNAFVQAVDGIITIIKTLWETTLKPFLQFCIAQATKLWNDSLKPLWDNLVNFILELTQTILLFWNACLAPLIDYIAATFGPLFCSVFQGIAGVFTNVVATLASGIDTVLSVLRGVLTFLRCVFTGDWAGAWDAVSSTAKAAWDGILNTVRTVVNSVVDLVNGMINAVVGGINSMISAVNSVGGAVGINLSPVTAPQLPHLANGGYVKANAPQLAVIGDNKHEGEIVAPESKLRQAVADGMAGDASNALLLQMIALLQTIAEKDQSISIGDEVIGRANARYQKNRGAVLGTAFADAM